MPFIEPPNSSYMHLTTNESHMQLISMTDGGSETPSSSPCFNAPPDEMPPSVVYIPGGKGAARWWARRTTIEKVALPLLFLFFLLLVLLTILLFNSRSNQATIIPIPLDRTVSGTHNDTPPLVPSELEFQTSTSQLPSSTTVPPKHDICFTPGCVRAATHLMDAMNQSVDPCTNFFEFACGRWNAYHPIPDDMYAFGTFAYVKEQVRQQLRVLLERETNDTSRSINIVRMTYKACMNTTEINQLKTSLLFKTLGEIGNWPLLTNDGKLSENSMSLTDLIIAARDFGVDAFFQFYIYADSNNTSYNTLFFDQGTLTLGRGSRDYYLNASMFASHINAYRKYMQDISKILKIDGNISRSDAEIYADFDKMITFETEMARIIVPEEERRNNTRLYNKRNISDMYEYMPQVDWLKFLKDSAPHEMKEIFHNETLAIVCEINFLKEMSSLIAKTDPTLLANYVVWRIVQSNVRYLDDRFEDIKQEFLRVMTGQQQSAPRWKECVSVPTTVLPLAAGAIYVEEHFKENDKSEALEMIGLLIEAFSELVTENNWMDDVTKRLAINKANAMIKNIGYPDITKDRRKLDERYQELDIESTDNYYELMKKSVLWLNYREFRKLLKPFNKREFDVSPAIVNAFYSPEKNSITFPAGILQPPFFSGEFPKAVNYGAIGAVIGHEISHAFDDQGSQYDKNGNLFNWWSAASLAAFNERRQCIIEQYSNYTVPQTNINVNGKLTQGENIADNGGVKESFRAYKKYIRTHGSEPRLPGLSNYSNEQIFFLSYAHFWCGQKKQAAAVQQVLTDEHSPEIFRIFGVLSNMVDFSEAYSCPPNSVLNPAKKCVVW